MIKINNLENSNYENFNAVVLSMTYFMPFWNKLTRLVLQITTLAIWHKTMDMKKVV